MKKVVILGSTGSIGRQALEIIRTDRSNFNVVGLGVGHNIEELKKQIEEFSPSVVSVFDKREAEKLKKEMGKRVKILSGEEGNIALVEEDVDIVVAAIVGTEGVYSVIRALEIGKRVALANKESLVVAGRFVKEAMERGGGEIIPVDSEHSAIFQILKGGEKKEVRRLILTASGGPFLNRKNLEDVTVEEALKHPTWRMGKKITIDSATMFNKGLEIIEAHWLFDFPPEKIGVLIHPQSIVHSMVEFVDGSIMAQMGPADMKIPISSALYYPDRWDRPITGFSLVDRDLQFFNPDFKKFPALPLAYRALEEGDLSCFIYSQSNEVAVSGFLRGEIGFTDIPVVVEEVMNMKDNFPEYDSHDIIKIERMITRLTLKVIENIKIQRMNS